MDIPVSDFDDFLHKLAGLTGQSAIFGFLLFDNRPSQKALERFARQQAEWIDDLARGAGICFFFPYRSENGAVENPSTEVIRIFKLGISRLPGIILFAPPGPDGKIPARHAVYIPLEEKDFEDAAIYEPILVDLFELISDSVARNMTSEAVLGSIKDELARLRRKRTGRGFARYIRKGAHLALFQLPRSILVSFAEGLGKALGDRAAGH